MKPNSQVSVLFISYFNLKIHDTDSNNYLVFSKKVLILNIDGESAATGAESAVTSESKNPSEIGENYDYE